MRKPGRNADGFDLCTSTFVVATDLFNIFIIFIYICSAERCHVTRSSKAKREAYLNDYLSFAYLVDRVSLQCMYMLRLVGSSVRFY